MAESILYPNDWPELVLLNYDEINIISMAKSNLRGAYIVEHCGILSVVTKKAVRSRAEGLK